MTSSSLASRTQPPISSPSAGAVPWAPHDYQKRAVAWLVKHPEAALFLDPGLGKTAIALKAFCALRKAGGAKRMLVVAPLRPAALVWSKSVGGEIAKWADFADLGVSLIHGNEQKRVVAVSRDADVYVINYDGMAWLVESGMLDVLVKKGTDVVFFDELSKMKHTKTRRFKSIKSKLGLFKRRWGGTGSPAANGLLDLFGEVYALDLGRRLGRFVTHYRFEYFVPTGYGGYTWVPKKDSDKRIHQKLGDLALSMRAEDHLDLPDLVERNIWVDLPHEAQRIYDAMQDELVAQLASGEVTAANAAVASGKCRQIASGGLYIDDDAGRRVTEHIHDAKTGALIDLVEELQGAPLLVGYEFHHDLARIRAALGDVPAINGSTTPARSVELARAWNAGELPVLCGHPAAMAHGINLQACGHHLAWYSLTWNYEFYDQFIRRVYRQGQQNRVVVHRILARDTVDASVLTALSRKARGQSALFDALKTLKRRAQ